MAVISTAHRCVVVLLSSRFEKAGAPSLQGMFMSVTRLTIHIFWRDSFLVPFVSQIFYLRGSF